MNKSLQSTLQEGQRYTNFDMNNESFARLFNFFITEIKNNTGYSRTQMIKGFGLTIRKWTGKHPKYISKKILDHFIDNNINVNPYTASYRPRNKFGIDIIFEHTTPISLFVKELSKTQTVEEIRNIMAQYSGISLVTLEEDRCLNSKGFSRKRPQGWLDAYRTCGIEVMQESEFEDYKNERNKMKNSDSSSSDFESPLY